MVIFFITIIFFFSDFFVKKLASFNLSYNKLYPFIDNIVYLRLVHNEGIAFGLFQDSTFLITILGFLLIGAFVFWIIKESRYSSVFEKVCLAMILGGGLCNLYDRVVMGYVVDYIDLRWWPVFNLSDSFITVGCILFILSVFKKNLLQAVGKCVSL